MKKKKQLELEEKKEETPPLPCVDKEKIDERLGSSACALPIPPSCPAVPHIPHNYTTHTK